MTEIAWYVVALAFLLDFIFADPKFLPHPVVFMGRAISFFEPRFRRVFSNPVISGGLFAVFLIFSTWLAGFILVKLSLFVHPCAGDFVQIILIFFCFSSKSLENAAMPVFDALVHNDIEKARRYLSMIVGRQTRNLDEKAVTRACVETVAENFVDGFLSPLFFALVGGAPLALCYKMINTLDSMVGYKNEKYILFGKIAARIDDAANFIPARLSVLIISFAGLFFPLNRKISIPKTGFSQGLRHKSPNAGFPEACFAAALEIKLGGPSIYHGIMVEKPFIGENFKDPDPDKIRQACNLMMFSSFVAAMISCFILFVF
jgi:adenosylcobinamide-phosphate synthase